MNDFTKEVLYLSNQKSPICQHTKVLIYLMDKEDGKEITAIKCDYCKGAWSLDGINPGIYIDE